MSRVSAFIVAFLALLVVLNPTFAKTSAAGSQIVVGNGTPASCTEAALDQALSQEGTVTFNCGPNPVTIHLTQEKFLRGTVTIDGGDKVTLDANRSDRIFKTDYYSRLTLLNLTLREGLADYKTGDRSLGQGGALVLGEWSYALIRNVKFIDNEALGHDACAGGGAIFFSGFTTAVIQDSLFSGNKAKNGGAINNLTSDLIISNTLFDGNEALHDAYINQPQFDNCGGGGAIYIDGASPKAQGGAEIIQIQDSIFRNNRTNHYGGAIVAFLYSTDHMAVDRSTFEYNRAEFFEKDGKTGGCSGAIWFGGEEYIDPSRKFTGKYVLSNSVINHNHADFIGGGLWAWNAPVELTNVTISNNEALNTLSVAFPYMQGIGGGLAIGTGDTLGEGVVLNNVTIANNTAGFGGGGINVLGNKASVKSTMVNTIVAYNTAGRPDKIQQNCTSMLADLGGNFQYPARLSSRSDDYNCTSAVRIADPLLAGLADNQGPTQTQALKSGSPAIDSGTASYCPMFDQRGYTRQGICDSGAFEYGGKPLVLSARVYLPEALK